ncbi:hypothetical protein [Bauldia sp.]|uniref:hypothetical protein n=1 Tax=Bauldia sp. TaxID=2575872 RepID=UPI003BAB450A
MERDGYEIRSSDPDKRGVVAYGRANWSFLRRGVSRPRIAARVDETSAGTARLTIESAPAFVPQMFGEPAHRHRAEIITLHLQQSLDP